MSNYINTVDSMGDAALCNALIEKTLGEIIDTHCATIGGYAFYKFSALRSAIFANSTRIEQYAFAYCSKLETVEIPLAENVGYFSFYECTKLKKADFPNVKSVNRYAFNGCTALETLALRSTTLATLIDINALEDTPIESGKGYIYVPAALIDSYKADSKWSTYANQFRKLENYTVDGTITGELDTSRCIVRFLNGDTVLQTVSVPYGGNALYTGDVPVSEEDASYEFKGWSPSPTNVTSDMDCYAEYNKPLVLNDLSWDEISAISAKGTGADYFAVGDTKEVALKGTVGTLELDATYNVYIIGFNHNSEVEGNGITFGTFKTVDGKDVCLVDTKYDSMSKDGTKYFNMNHWDTRDNGNRWSSCDLRYDILGSTNVAPSNYGTIKTSSAVGYDATETCATNPVPNTLMSALPSELRAVMKPMTKYTDGATVDYLPLLAEFEVLGNTTNAQEENINNQKKYDYFTTGSIKKYKHSSATESSGYWLRSRNWVKYFCYISGYADVASTTGNAYKPNGIAPIFKV